MNIITTYPETLDKRTTYKITHDQALKMSDNVGTTIQVDAFILYEEINSKGEEQTVNFNCALDALVEDGCLFFDGKNYRLFTNEIGLAYGEIEINEIAGRKIKWYSFFGKQLNSFLRNYTYHKMQQLHSLSTKRSENIYPYKDLYVTVHRGINHNSKIMEITPMSINW